MAGYKPITNFRVKDIYAAGNPQKLIVGAELQREFEAINASVSSMTDAYNGPLTNFAAKDLLATGNANKKVLGATLDAEFNAINTAFSGVPGWSYTRITTFASEVTVTGDKIQDELESLGTALTAIWIAGGGSASWGSTDSGSGATGVSGPFWTAPVIGFQIVAGQITQGGTPRAGEFGLGNGDATGHGFGVMGGGTLVSNTIGSGLSPIWWEQDGAFMNLILAGSSAPAANVFTSMRWTDSAGTVRTVTLSSAVFTGVSGTSRRWLWDVSALLPVIPNMTSGLTRTIEFIP